jgi:uncharacterized membrane protein
VRRAEARKGGTRKPDSRLPRWTYVTILAGGVVAYVAVGTLLLGHAFGEGLAQLFTEPAAFARGGAEAVAPFVLLLVPAVLGGIFTRDALRIVVRGLRRGDATHVVAKELAIFILSFLVLVVVGLFSQPAIRSR